MRHEVAPITVKIVSLRQNGVGPNKTCADAILPKGHDSIKKEEEEKKEILAKAKAISDQIGLWKFAKLAGVDAANLYHSLKGNRNLSTVALGKIQIAIAKIG